MRPFGTPVIVPTSATLENYPMSSKRIEWAPSSVEVNDSLVLLKHSRTFVSVFSQRSVRCNGGQQVRLSIIQRLRRVHDRLGCKIGGRYNDFVESTHTAPSNKSPTCLQGTTVSQSYLSILSLRNCQIFVENFFFFSNNTRCFQRWGTSAVTLPSPASLWLNTRKNEHKVLTKIRCVKGILKSSEICFNSTRHRGRGLSADLHSWNGRRRNLHHGLAALRRDRARSL